MPSTAKDSLSKQYPVRSAVSQKVTQLPDLAKAFNSAKALDRGPREARDRQQPDVYRIILNASIETLWTDLSLCSTSSHVPWELNGVEDALQVEARILQYTQPTLCLDPTFEVTRLANNILRATTLPCPEAGHGDGVAGKKRKRPAVEELSAAEKAEQARRERVMRMYDEATERTFVPTFSRINLIQTYRQRQEDDKRRKVEQDTKQALQQHLNDQSNMAEQSSFAVQSPAAPLTIQLKGPARKPSKLSIADEGSPPPTAIKKKGKPGPKPYSQSMNSIVIEADSPPALKGKKGGYNKKKKNSTAAATIQIPQAAPMSMAAAQINAAALPMQAMQALPVYNPLLNQMGMQTAPNPFPNPNRQSVNALPAGLTDFVQAGLPQQNWPAI